MKNFFTGVLILNLLVEGLAAVSLIGAPQAMFPEGQALAAMWARNYGFAVIGIGSAVFWTWPYRDNFKVVSAVLGMLLTFHISVLVALATWGEQLSGAIIHTVMSVLCVFLYTQRSKWCMAEQSETVA